MFLQLSTLVLQHFLLLFLVQACETSNKTELEGVLQPSAFCEEKNNFQTDSEVKSLPHWPKIMCVKAISRKAICATFLDVAIQTFTV